MCPSPHLRGVLLTALLVCSTAWAQEPVPMPGFDLERLEPNPGRGALLVGSGELLLPGTVRFSLLGHYQRRPLSLVQGEQRLAVVSDRTTSVVTGAVGVLSWLELGVQLSGVVWQASDDLSLAGLTPPASRGFSSPLAQARLGLLSVQAGHVLDMSLDVGLGLPVGSSRALTRDAGVRFSSRLAVGRRFGWLRPGLEAGVVLRPSVPLGPEGVARDTVGSELRLGAALSTVGEGLQGELDVRAVVTPGRLHGAVEAMGGVRYPVLPELEVFALGGGGLGAVPGTPLFRVLVGVSLGDPPPPEPVVYGERNP